MAVVPRKIVTYRETTFVEGGRAAPRPLDLFAAAAIMRPGQSQVHLGREGGRLAVDEDDAAGRVAAVQGTLRPLQYLDILYIRQGEEGAGAESENTEENETR